MSLSGSPGTGPVLNAPVAAGTRIGHVHLKVADLDRALGFYVGVLGFQVMQRLGAQAAFISAGGYHHHIGLNTWESRGGHPPASGTTGLFHTAILYPTRAALADALRRLIAAGIPLDGASDHGVSEALYLRDPDENGVELYWDRPETDWPRDGGGALSMFTKRLDLDALLATVGAYCARLLRRRTDNGTVQKGDRRISADPRSRRRKGHIHPVFRVTDNGE